MDRRCATCPPGRAAFNRRDLRARSRTCKPQFTRSQELRPSTGLRPDGNHGRLSRQPAESCDCGARHQRFTDSLKPRGPQREREIRTRPRRPHGLGEFADIAEESVRFTEGLTPFGDGVTREWHNDFRDGTQGLPASSLLSSIYRHRQSG